MSSNPLRIWCAAPDQHGHIQPVERHFGAKAVFTYDRECEPGRMLEARPDLVLCVNDFPYEIARCLDAARSSGIPSLLLQDGILEWRCQYENPLFGYGGGAPQHQPVLADKIACIGNQSARHIAAWGNAEKVEVTGMPRLDALSEWPCQPRRTPGRTILVMTAKNPGFTPEQTEISVRSLLDVKEYLAAMPGVKAIWRVRRDILDRLHVENQLEEFSSGELARVIENCDAVISTVSTALLESMLLKRPSAALDYHNVPRFVPTAWTITAREQIGAAVAEMLEPPVNKMAFQQNCLEDCLRYGRPASARVAALIERMVAYAQKAGNPPGLRLPPAMLGGAVTTPSAPPPLSDLYPNQPIFRETDAEALQLRLVRLERRYRQLQKELNGRTIRGGLYLMGRRVSEYLRSRA